MLAALGRRWRLLGLAGAIVILHVPGTVMPLLPRQPPSGLAPSIRVVTANLLMENDSLALLAGELEGFDADVYFLQELSARWDDEFERRGFWLRYPYNRRITGENPFGCAIASRLPLRDLEVFSMAELPAVRGRLVLGGREIEIVSLHLMAPIDAEQGIGHRLGADRLLQRLKRTRGKSFILAGDFNATSDSFVATEMREFADDGWELAGRGFGATWPNGVFLAPPIRIDHVYVSRDLTVTRIATGTGAGSDHKPLVAEIALRRP
jgi:endonuclease/exonuclease/phosphatase (EEP) superfamily protein YafD